ncbi:hypothetical protein AOQ84DRAFT_350832 [Glonium stellatum]|uniref:Uncharacterized protein n=1 Tax=Glonium stellatum TaxID=574774 RepID=A0A8E2EMD0_9PEZI|nr:hypothetical protein AOQ84DRAFT_350832 [Glonium stellatum]
MDPHKSTREEFTKNIISIPLPSEASPKWTEEVNKLRELLDKLAHHPAMASNLSQTYMTPAADKNKVYFMWDYVGRTLGMLCNEVNPQLKGSKKAWEEVIGRISMAKELLLDTKPGMLHMMTEATYPEQKGKHPEFGEEILELARRL